MQRRTVTFLIALFFPFSQAFAISILPRSYQSKFFLQPSLISSHLPPPLTPSHPPQPTSSNPQPAYYLPPTARQIPTSRTHAVKRSLCEWKGAAIYWNITPPTTPTTSPTPTSTPISSTTSLPKQVTNRIWSYESPTKPFAPIKGYLSFYAGPWDCFVDGEKVAAQPGDFYGGWVTSEIEGRVKGGPGTWGW